MKLSGLIDALIASGGTVEQVRAVVLAAEAAQDAETAEKRAKAAAKKRRQRAGLSPFVPGTHGDRPGQTGTDGDTPAPLSSFPPDPPNNYPPTPGTHTHTAPGARADALAGFEPSPADVAELEARGLNALDIAAELPPFRDHWLASHEPLPADLGAAFRGFCRHGQGRRKPPRAAGQGARASPHPASVDDSPRVNTPSGMRSVAFLMAEHRAGRWSSMYGPAIGKPGCLVPEGVMVEA